MRVLLLQGTFAANAAGFKMESLAKLDDTKSNKARVTLMHYVAEVGAGTGFMLQRSCIAVSTFMSCYFEVFEYNVLFQVCHFFCRSSHRHSCCWKLYGVQANM